MNWKLAYWKPELSEASNEMRMLLSPAARLIVLLDSFRLLIVGRSVSTDVSPVGGMGSPVTEKERVLGSMPPRAAMASGSQKCVWEVSSQLSYLEYH